MTTKHERAGWDGVANVKYRVDSIINNQTFTTIRVDLRRFITHQVQIKTARRPLMTINPQEREPCKWVELPGKYLDAQFIKGTTLIYNNFYYFKIKSSEKTIVALLVSKRFKKSVMNWVRHAPVS